MLITQNNFKILNISQEFIENLISNGIEESQHLEYKEIFGSNQEIAKDISSFANSDGGNIIYGIIERDHKPFKINPITLEGIREKIDQISLDGIDPPLNIKIWPIDINLEDESGQVYIVYIPKKYPFLYFAKKNHRFYKRSNFTSTPMERFEIALAYKLQLEVSEKLNKTLKRVEDQFKNEYRYANYEFRFIVYPLQYGEDLFKINSEMNNFFLKERHKTPLYKENVFFKRDNLDIRQKGYIFKSELGKHNVDCLIRNDGIIIYSLHFKLCNRDEYERFVGHSISNFDRYERLMKGLVLKDDRIFNRELFIDYFLGFIELLYYFFKKIEFFGDIKLKLKIVHAFIEWSDIITGNPFKQHIFDPIENIYNVELIQSNRLKIVKDFFNPIFNGFGIMEEDLEGFYHSLELKLKKI